MKNTLAVAFLFLACGPQAVPLEPTGEVATSSVVVNPDPQQPPVVLAGFPCAVRDALQANCAACHAGAFYIVRFTARADFFTELADGSTFGQRVLSRLDSPSEPMPPAGVQRVITAAERSTIADWVSEGMPGGECGDLTDP